MKFILPLLLIGVISSCTITKRVHQPGWHVEWRSANMQQEKDQVQENAKEQQSHNEFNGQQTAGLTETEQESETTTTVSTNTLRVEQSDAGETDKQPNLVAEQKPTKSVLLENQSEDPKATSSARPEPLGILSLVSSSGALIFFLNICFLLSDNGWNPILGLSYPWLFFISLSLAVIGLVFAIMSLKRLKESPELYKGKGRAWTGLGMSLGVSGLVLVLLLCILLVFLFETFFYW